MVKVGLALGGGGVRGFAHLGVIEVLEREGVPIDLIVGSSIGAAVGSMYAFRPKIAPSITQFRHYLHSELYDNTKLAYLRQSEESRENLYEKLKIRFAQGAVFATSLSKTSLFSEETLRKNVQYLIPPVNIEESLVPVSIITFDLCTGKEVVLTEGPLLEAVMASCAIPGVFPPIEREDMQLMDGGIVNPVPCDVARRQGAEVVIAVDLSPEPDPLAQLSNSYEMAMRAADISRFRLKKMIIQDADVVIPVETSEVFWADFSQFDHCVEVGRRCAQAALPRIRKVLSQ